MFLVDSYMFFVCSSFVRHMLLYVLVMFWYPQESFGMFKTFLAVLVARFNDLSS